MRRSNSCRNSFLIYKSRFVKMISNFFGFISVSTKVTHIKNIHWTRRKQTNQIKKKLETNHRQQLTKKETKINNLPFEMRQSDPLETQRLRLGRGRNPPWAQLAPMRDGGCCSIRYSISESSARNCAVFCVLMSASDTCDSGAANDVWKRWDIVKLLNWSDLMNSELKIERENLSNLRGIRIFYKEMGCF